MNAFYPPLWEEGSDSRFLLGTDDQEEIFFLRSCSDSVFPWELVASVILCCFRNRFGLNQWIFRGNSTCFILRVADIQLTFPAILIALLIDGIVGKSSPKIGI